jgi:hypothetical protein
MSCFVNKLGRRQCYDIKRIDNEQAFESNKVNIKADRPFFADGIPDLMFHDTTNGQYVNPHK